MMRVSPHDIPMGPQGRLRIDRMAPPGATQLSASGRPRVDAHLEYRARERREMRLADLPVAAAHAPPAPKALPVHQVADSAPLVLVYLPEVAPWAGAAGDLLGTAREIYGAHRIALVSFGTPEAEPMRDGADRVLTLPELEGEAARIAFLASLIEHLSPVGVIFPDTGLGGDMARRLAARTRQPTHFGVAAIARGKLVVPCEGGRREALCEAAPLMTLARSACAAPDGRMTYEGRAMDLPAPVVAALGQGLATDAPRFVDAGRLAVSAADLALTEAKLILSAGAGLSDWDGFHAVADALGAAEAGSRVVCDAGDLPRARQVGASGTIVESRFYIACGISGAPQHLQGIAKCRHVVAINTDRHAPIMDRAELALVADADAVLAELRKLLEAGQ